MDSARTKCPIFELADRNDSCFGISRQSMRQGSCLVSVSFILTGYRADSERNHERLTRPSTSESNIHKNFRAYKSWVGCCLKRFNFSLILITGNHAFSFVHSHTPASRLHYAFTLVIHPFLRAGEIISSSWVCGSDRVRAYPACAPAWEGQKARSSMRPPRV